MTSRPNADSTEEPRPVRRSVTLSTHVASAGLVVVLALLMVFSVSAAIGNAAAAAQAELSVEVSEWADQAESSLALQEEYADQRVDGDNRQLAARYQSAVAATRKALRQIADIAHGEGEPPQLERWLHLQDEYESAVAQLLVVAESGPAAAEEFEDEYVDSFFQAIEEVVHAESREHRRDADDALAELRDSQQMLLWVTPAVFGVGLLLVAWCTTVLVRSRREAAAQAEENRRQVLHDSLTGLPNRTLLLQRIEAALAAEGQDGGTVAVMVVDLDRFREINDSLGHASGDAVLETVAARLTRAVRDTDTVARLGADEFAVVLPGVEDVAAARELALRMQASLVRSVDAMGAALDIDASIGIAVSGAECVDVNELLRNADIAMHAAKSRGLGVSVFDATMDSHTPGQLGLLSDLRRAIDARELVLHYQPKITSAGEVGGVEALVRWAHPERGMVSPAVFIPLAERTPLIHALTRLVIDTALAQCARWRADGRNLQVAVNVSARNLLDDSFVEDVLALLARRRLPASSLELEVTESAIMAEPVRAQQMLGRLAAAGVTLSIDDFGAGYTSLAHLKGLPVHQLKIDRSFVSQMTVDPSDAVIVRSVIELAHNLGLSTVAEGVEDEATWRELRAAGCDLAQGYHLARPMPADELDVWFASAHRGRELTSGIGSAR